MDGRRRSGIGAKVGERGGITEHRYLAGAERRGLSAGAMAGNHINVLDEAVDMDRLGGKTSWDSQWEPSPSFMSRSKGKVRSF